MDVTSSLARFAEQVNVRLDDLLPRESDIPSLLHQAMRYSAMSPGKRLRPALALAGAEAAGFDAESALDGACAVECIHAFSLIHDDLPAIDNDDLRRGRPTCHKAFPESVAILAGDALFALAFEIIADSGCDPVRIGGACGWLARTSRDLVRGETLDVLSEGQPHDEKTLEFIHRNKTGALLACSAGIGALLCGAEDRLVLALNEYGQHLGLAFQIHDDILNETATSETLGKAAGSDKARGKLTYPALFGIEASQKEAERHVYLAKLSLRDLPGDTELLSMLADYAIARAS